MTYSLRARLTGWIAAAVLVLLGGFSLILYSTTRYALIGNFDKALLNTATLLTATIALEEHEGEERAPAQNEVRPGEFDLEFDLRMTPEFGTGGGGFYAIYDARQDLIAKSPSYRTLTPAMPAGLGGSPRYGRCALPDGRPGRSVGFRFNLENSDRAGRYDYTVVLCRDAGDLDRFLANLKGLLLAAGALAVVLAVVIARAVTVRGLRPVQTLGDQIAAINADNLAQSNLAGTYPVELQPMADCLNNLLARLQRSFAMERRFTGDVAHELRTPIAGLQASLDVCLSRSREEAAYRTTLTDCREIVLGMNRMIDSLLAMARLDAGRVKLNLESIGLGSIVEQCWAIHAENAATRQVAFSHTLDRTLTIRSDRDYLTMILSNLLDNAADYSNAGGRIWISAGAGPNGVRLIVSNTGCALAPEDADKVFDPFWQNDPSRSATGKHCGIGLTIVRKMVRALGGQTGAKVLAGGVFAIHIDLPG